jgi:hypothetical protein
MNHITDNNPRRPSESVRAICGLHVDASRATRLWVMDAVYEHDGEDMTSDISCEACKMLYFNHRARISQNGRPTGRPRRNALNSKHRDL